MNQWLKWYAAHAYWFFGLALFFLGIAVYFLLYRYPSRKNKVLFAVNVLAVAVLVYTYWL